MSRSEHIILGIDPGKTTGWSMGQGNEVIESGQRPWQEFVDRWLPSCLASCGVTKVIIESFDPRQWTLDSALTVEIIGAIQSHSRRAGISPDMVTPSSKAKTLPDVSEAVVGRHARDAEAIRLWHLRYGRGW